MEAATANDESGGGRVHDTGRLAAVVLTVVALLVTAAVWWGGRDASAASPGGLAPTSRAARLVPKDGARTITRHGEDVVVSESARTSGDGFALTTAAVVVGDVEKSVGADDLAALSVWRTTRTTYDAPTGTAQTTTSRALTARGIEQLATSGAGTTLVFTPGLLEVPAGVAAGSTWKGTGTASPDGSIHYSSSFSADPVAGRADCLEVTGSIAFTQKDGSTITDSASDDTWCDGAGIVTTGDHAAAAPLWTGPTDPPPSLLGDVPKWTVAAVPTARADATFGTSPFQAQVDVTPVRLEDFTLVVPDATTGDLLGLQLPESTLVPSWLAHPGGTIVTLAAVGELSVVGTTGRTLTAYGNDGAFRWQRRFADVPFTTPVDLGDGRLAVTALDGTVAVVDAATGRDVWSATMPAEVRAAPVVSRTVSGASAGARLVVADRSGVVRSFDLDTGRVQWSTSGDAMDAIALAGTTLVGVNASGVATGLSLGDGVVGWTRSVGSGSTALVGLDGVAAVVTPDRTVGLDATTGATRWATTGSTLATGLGDAASSRKGATGSQVLAQAVGAEVVAVDATGHTLGRWTPSGLRQHTPGSWFLVPSATGVDVVDGVGHVARVAT